MNSLWTLLLPLAERTPDPADVKPGWVALGLVLLMGAAVVFLGFSLVKHLRRTRENFDALGREDPGSGDPPGSDDRGPT